MLGIYMLDCIFPGNTKACIFITSAARTLPGALRGGKGWAFPGDGIARPGPGVARHDATAGRTGTWRRTPWNPRADRAGSIASAPLPSHGIITSAKYPMFHAIARDNMIVMVAKQTTGKLHSG